MEGSIDIMKRGIKGAKQEAKKGRKKVSLTISNQSKYLERSRLSAETLAPIME